MSASQKSLHRTTYLGAIRGTGTPVGSTSPVAPPANKDYTPGITKTPTGTNVAVAFPYITKQKHT